jgi:hypothetical protein
MRRMLCTLCVLIGVLLTLLLVLDQQELALLSLEQRHPNNVASRCVIPLPTTHTRGTSVAFALAGQQAWSPQTSQLTPNHAMRPSSTHPFARLRGGSGRCLTVSCMCARMRPHIPPGEHCGVEYAV